MEQFKNIPTHLKGFMSTCWLLLMTLSAQAQQTTVVCEKKVQAYLNESYHYTKSVDLLPGFSFEAGVEETRFCAESVTEAGVTVTEDPCQTITPYSITIEAIKKEGIQTSAQVDALTEEEKVTSTTYLDGLGRSVQSVVHQASPLKKDMVSQNVFDAFGRVQRQYMGYTATTNDGSFHHQAVSEQLDFYQNGATRVENSDYPYAEVKYEKSPLNRVLEGGAQGKDWQLDQGHTDKGHIEVNNANEIRYWKYNQTPPYYYSDSYYPAGSLIKGITTDSEGNQSVTYTDPFGNVVYSASEVSETNGVTEWAETYNIYDDFLRLAFIISPEGVKELANTGNSNWSLQDAAFVDRWATCYKYDERHRITEQTINGAGTDEVVYNRYNHVVMTRNAEQRTNNEWVYIKCDYLGRPTMTGIYNNPASRSQQAQNIETFYANTERWTHYEQRTTTTRGYTLDQSYPTDATIVHNTFYYDDYDFNNDGTADYQLTNTLLGNAAVAQTHLGLQTGNKTLILETTQELRSVTFYDEYYRVQQVRKDNELTPIMNDYLEVHYNDEYEADEVVEFHTVNGKQIAIKNRVEYDHIGRMTNMYQSVNEYIASSGTPPPGGGGPVGGNERQICAYKYNELGMVIEKDLHQKDDGNFLQSIDYSFNIRGWLTGINNSELTNDGTKNNDNNDLFGLELLYNDASGFFSPSGGDAQGAEGANLRYDGLITGVKWQTKHTQVNASTQRERSFTYEYDKLNRLTSSNYAAKEINGNGWTEELDGYNTAYTYDLNGNIQTLQRYALYQGAAQREQIDNLVYRYDANGDGTGASTGNKLTRVEDLSTAASRDQGYKAAAVNYQYNSNGNTTFDAHKSVTLAYNHLNLAKRVTKSANDFIDYTFDGMGNKLAKRVTEAGAVTRHIHYIGSCIYDGNDLQYFLFAEGRVKKNGLNNFTYEYHITDHQGNARVMFEEDPTTHEAVVVQEAHYYAFGMKMDGVVNGQPEPSDQNNWLYSGIELQEELGLDWYAYNLRSYDPSLGRWFAQDPYDQFHSPYTAMGDDPINMIDPTGGYAYGGGGGWQGSSAVGNGYITSTTTFTTVSTSSPLPDGNYDVGTTGNDGKYLYSTTTSSTTSSTTTTNMVGGGGNPTGPTDGQSKQQVLGEPKGVIIFDSRNQENGINKDYYQSDNWKLYDLATDGGLKGVNDKLNNLQDNSLSSAMVLMHGGVRHVQIEGGENARDEYVGDFSEDFKALFSTLGCKLVSSSNSSSEGSEVVGNLIIAACGASDIISTDGYTLDQGIKGLIGNQRLWLVHGNWYITTKNNSAQNVASGQAFREGISGFITKQAMGVNDEGKRVKKTFYYHGNVPFKANYYQRVRVSSYNIFLNNNGSLTFKKFTW